MRNEGYVTESRAIAMLARRKVKAKAENTVFVYVSGGGFSNGCIQPNWKRYDEGTPLCDFCMFSGNSEELHHLLSPKEKASDAFVNEFECSQSCVFCKWRRIQMSAAVNGHNSSDYEYNKFQNLVHQRREAN
jgi:hypothetical protein